MSKYIDLEDTVFWKTKIVSFNINNIDYIEKSSNKKIVIGFKGIAKYYVDANINNLTKLYLSELIGYTFIANNYPGMEIVVGFKSNEQILTDMIIKSKEREGVKRNDIRRHKK